jgi:hypothetical protein
VTGVNFTPSAELVPGGQLAVYHGVIREASNRGLRFAVGGSLAMAVYAGRVRKSKDLDLYTTPAKKDGLIEALGHLGLQDYYERLPYDRSWIYRATTDDTIVDIIWAMANHRTVVDDDWLVRGPEIRFGSETLKLIPLEEMIWSKLYILQRDRCDWPDILNLLDTAGHQVDWERLLDRIGEDTSLLAGVLNVYCWLRSDNARRLPEWLWARLAPSPHALVTNETTQARAALLDSRPWLMSTVDGGSSEC